MKKIIYNGGSGEISCEENEEERKRRKSAAV
jgi:hypothetical protein